MKKNNKGFFLAETIVVLSLVTAVMAFVYPNTAKLYETFKNKSYYYDQTQDIYTLKAIYESHKDKIDEQTISTCDGQSEDEIGTRIFNQDKLDLTNQVIPRENEKIGDLAFLYLTGYVTNSSDDTDDYNFKKYINRIRKTTYDSSSYRLIGVFKKDNETRYATIKIKNPNPNRNCNLGG